jgi:hypothetical protein
MSASHAARTSLSGFGAGAVGASTAIAACAAAARHRLNSNAELFITDLQGCENHPKASHCNLHLGRRISKADELTGLKRISISSRKSSK